MTKEQRRGNKEVRKPRKQEEAIPAPVTLVKNAASSNGSLKGSEKKSRYCHEYPHI